ncbi:MAG: metallophosphoesterase [Bacteroidota bacterium]
MKIQFCSDLHLEFPDNREFLNTHPIQVRGDILLLAGDIVPLGEIERHADFFNYLSDSFQAIYWVPGNHEYYHYDIAELWSKISALNQSAIQNGLSDFRAIKLNHKAFLPSHYNRLYEESVIFLKEELSGDEYAKRIVVTHHVPTFLNYPEKYRGDVLNEAFATELYDLIEETGIDYWIFGHHHQNIPDFKIGKSTLVTNQLGYVLYNEHQRFDLSRTIEL